MGDIFFLFKFLVRAHFELRGLLSHFPIFVLFISLILVRRRPDWHLLVFNRFKNPSIALLIVALIYYLPML